MTANTRGSTSGTYHDCSAHRQRALEAADADAALSGAEAPSEPAESPAADVPARPPAHGHAHAHGHGHHHHGPGAHHHHDPRDPTGMRALRAALVLTAAFLLAEVVGGYLSNSLALLADAGHMFTDVAALGLALFASWLATRPAAPGRTYGWLRWEILAAFLNGAVLLVVSGGIALEALQRLRSPEPVATGLMFWVAVGGLLVNATSAWILHGASSLSLNVRGAYLHVLSDLLGSVATIIAALAVRYLGWLAADPVASLVMAVLIVRSAWRLLREATDVLLEAAPPHIAVPAVREALQAVPDVTEVHDLHVWAIDSRTVALSAHVVVPDLARHERALAAARERLEALGISHVTLQLERARSCE